MGSNFQDLRPWNHLLGWGVLYRGVGSKNGLQGVDLLFTPPHAHLWMGIFAIQVSLMKRQTKLLSVEEGGIKSIKYLLN